MVEQGLTEVYTKFKIHFYQEMFKKLHSRETSLSIVELFCVEIIHALGNPSVKEFSEFIDISSPNAAYKISCLIDKGYIEKVQSEKDRREYHLHVTDKYLNYLNLSQGYVSEVAKRCEDKFTPERTAELNEILKVMSNELMSEVDIPHIKIDEK